MATIPIEVIVQDKASPEPTPTPSDSGETNIVVPDTGAGTVENGSNGGGIGSAVSIILPAIILVLAIGVIVALFVRRYQKRKKTNDGIKEYDTKESKRTVSRKEKLTTVASGTIAILAATVLVGNLVIPVTSAATSVEPGIAELDTVDKITITATREIDSDITVATVKNTSYATANLDFGYKVTASMAENATTANLYLDGDETSEYYIAPVENEGEGEDEGNEDVIGNAELANNTWGYTLEEPSEGTTYLPIPLEDTPATITKGNDMVEDEAVDIYYAIKVEKDLPAGSYIGELEYNISPAVEYMQDFATMTEEEKTAILANMPENKQYILKDIRDKKPYYISKLADGNVWMTQNLDLDLSAEVTLTPEDTDISENWTPLRSTISFTGTTVDGWGSDSYTPYSADPGDVYYYTSGTDADDMKYDSLEECEAEYSDDSCQHYHAGNYYNWSAAVASNDTSEMTEEYQDAPDSICPSGWRLPEGPSSEEPYYHDLSNLAISYPNVITELTRGCGGGCLIHKYLPNGFNAIRTVPLWYVRSGVIGEVAQPESSVRRTGYSGCYWSNTAIYNYAVRLYFDNTEVKPNDGYGRVQGYSVRCVAR